VATHRVLVALGTVAAIAAGIAQGADAVRPLPLALLATALVLGVAGERARRQRPDRQK
jgi:multisubunit Na+/H+ antiporter MnhC subunit